MKNHEVSLENLNSFNFEYLFAAESRAGRGSKQLMVYVDLQNETIYYKVYLNSTALIKVKDKHKAIKLYNDICL